MFTLIDTMRKRAAFHATHSALRDLPVAVKRDLGIEGGEYKAAKQAIYG